MTTSEPDAATQLDLGHDPSLSDLHTAILTAKALPLPRRRAIASAINTVGKALGVAPWRRCQPTRCGCARCSQV